LRGAPPYAAAIDVPISLPPPSFAPEPLEPIASNETLGGTTGSIQIPRRIPRRRAAIVLGSVGGLGVLVFTLAAWRVSHRDSDASSSTPHASAVASAAPKPSSPVVAPPVAPAAPAPTTLAQPAALATPPPAADPVATPHSNAASQSHAGASKAKSATPKAAATHSPAPAGHTKPKSKPTFDPNAL
jgi:hypothetical protein